MSDEQQRGKLPDVVEAGMIDHAIKLLADSPDALILVRELLAAPDLNDDKQDAVYLLLSAGWQPGGAAVIDNITAELIQQDASELGIPGFGGSP